MKVGDLVVRKSYDRDITFKIIDIKINEEGKEVYILKGNVQEEEVEKIKKYLFIVFYF